MEAAFLKWPKKVLDGSLATSPVLSSEGWLSSFLSPPFLHAPGLEKEATMSADKFLPNSPGFPGSLRKGISQQRLTVKIKERPNLVLCFRLPAPGRSRARSETGRPLGKAVGSSQFSQLSFCSTGSPLSAGLYFRQGPQAEQSPTLWQVLFLECPHTSLSGAPKPGRVAWSGLRQVVADWELSVILF